MTKILGVKIEYPKGINESEGHKELQNRAMQLLANCLVKKLPREDIEKIILRLKYKDNN